MMALARSGQNVEQSVIEIEYPGSSLYGAGRCGVDRGAGQSIHRVSLRKR